MNEKYYVTVQSRPTGKYKDSRYREGSITIPSKLFNEWKLKPSQVLEIAFDGSHVSITKVQEKPKKNTRTYEEWLEHVKGRIPIQSPGNTYEQICKEAGIPYKSPSAIWVNWAKNDIGLNNQFKDPKTHRTLWMRTPETSIVMPKTRDAKINDPKFLTVMTRGRMGG